ncbi:unnamed protein product [Phaeothamnion confervicola]
MDRLRRATSGGGGGAAPPTPPSQPGRQGGFGGFGGFGGDSDSGGDVIFVLLGGRLEIFDLMSGVPLAIVQTSDLTDGLSDPLFVRCVDASGLPIGSVLREDGHIRWAHLSPLASDGGGSNGNGGSRRGSTTSNSTPSSEDDHVEPHLLVVLGSSLALVALEASGTGLAGMATAAASAVSAVTTTLAAPLKHGRSSSNDGVVLSSQPLLHAGLRICAAARLPPADDGGALPAGAAGAGICWTAFWLEEEGDDTADDDDENGSKIGGKGGGGKGGGGGDDGGVEKRATLMVLDGASNLTAFLLPSLTIVHSRHLPDAAAAAAAAVATTAAGAGSADTAVMTAAAAAPPLLPLAVNALGELTLRTGPRELARFSILGQACYERLLDGRQRLVKVAEAVAANRRSHRARVEPEAGQLLTSAAAAAATAAATAATAARSPGTPSGRSKWSSMLRNKWRGSGSSKSIDGGGGDGGGGGGASSYDSGGGRGRAAAARIFDACGDLSETRRREELFAGRRPWVQTSPDGAVGSTGTCSGNRGGLARAHGGVDDTKAAVSEAQKLALENVEKLGKLENRTAQLEDNAANFVDMARELRRRQEAQPECIVS